MKTYKEQFGYELDQEEQEILEAFEQGKCERSDTLGEDIEKAKKAAKNSLKKDAKVNIRLTQQDLQMIKGIAATEGLPYQTLISSLLHKYAMRYNPNKNEL